ncbi:MAG TPA: nucleoside deaminase [Acidimicrobiia bacterium]|jgi:tRNA(adenine34) deaminase
MAKPVGRNNRLSDSDERTAAVDRTFMELALAEARLAAAAGEVPIGAVLVDPDGRVVASNRNRREELADPTAHAEMLVISAAARAKGDWRLTGHSLYVTLEPCAMCAGAAVLARLATVVYGAADLKAGAAWSLYNIPQDARLNHRCELRHGVLQDEAAALLADFFARQR